MALDALGICDKLGPEGIDIVRLHSIDAERNCFLAKYISWLSDTDSAATASFLAFYFNQHARQAETIRRKNGPDRLDRLLEFQVPKSSLRIQPVRRYIRRYIRRYTQRR